MLAITKDLEKWDTKQSGITQVPVISNMKRKATFSPESNEEFEVKPLRLLTKIEREETAEKQKKKKIVLKQKIDTMQNMIRKNSNALSVLNEEPDHEERVDTR